MVQKASFYRNILIVAILIAVYLLASYFVTGHTELTVCPSRMVFGLPCPGCGLSRAVNLLWKGDVGGAIAMNANVLVMVPLGIVAFMVLVYDICTHSSRLYAMYMWICAQLHGWVLVVIFAIEIVILILNVARDGFGWPWLH